MIEEVIKKYSKSKIEELNNIFMSKTGRKMTDTEEQIFRLGLSTGICIAGVGLSHSEIDLNA